MRLGLVIGAALLTACAHEAPPPRTTVIYKVIYKCRPEPPGGCNSITERSQCGVPNNKRCQWVARNSGRSYCRKIHCVD